MRAEALQRASAYIGGIIRGIGADPMAIGGVADHAHALVGVKATHNVAEVMKNVKASSSIWASARRPGFAWQTGYGAFSVGYADLDKVRAYIARQEEHHRRVSSADEMRALLEEFGVPVDARYFE